MNARCIGPVRFNREHGEIFLRDQSFRDLRALEIKFVRPMRSFAEQNNPRVADELEQRVIIIRLAAKRLRQFTNKLRISHDRSSP